MGCICPSSDPKCYLTCMAIWYLQWLVENGGTGTQLIEEDDHKEEALALIEQLADATNEENQTVDFNLFTSTAEDLYGLNQLTAAFALSHNITSAIGMANFYDYLSVEETKTILQRNYRLQSEIFVKQGGSGDGDWARIALEGLNEWGSKSGS